MLETAPGTELAEIVTVAAWPIPVYVCGEFDIAKVVGVALFTVKETGVLVTVPRACNNYPISTKTNTGRWNGITI
jgi:hypothetical protein